MATEKSKPKTLKHVLDGIRKKHGESILGEPGELVVYSTGLKTIDLITGIGGFPAGRIVELYSPEGCGKTTLAIHCAVQVQKQKKMVVWADYECCFMKDYAETLGLGTNEPNFILLKPEYAEIGFDAILRLVEVGNVGLIVIDSVAACVPQVETDVLGFGDTQVGLQSRKITAFVKSLIPKISSAGIAAIFINQLRSAISFNAHMPTTQTTPGGRALKFYASLRVHLQMGKALKKKDEDAKRISGAPEKRAFAHIVHVAVTKNKLAVPYRCGDIQLVHGKGFQEVGKIEGTEEEETKVDF